MEKSARQTKVTFEERPRCHVRLDTIANNRAWGNSPDLARTLAHRFLDAAERRGL